MIVLLALLHMDDAWVVSVATYSTKAECFAVLDATAESYHRKFPAALLWCSEPIGYVGE